MQKIISSQISSFANCVKNFPLKFKASSKLIFVCGAKPNPDNPTARDLVKKYADKHLDSFQFFIAEDFFSAFQDDKKMDLLSIEANLCKYSDCILIILEGNSAFAELGAFALHKELVKQVLVINEIKYRDSDSFIIKGPIAKINRESSFTPSIHANFKTILESATDIEKSLEKIHRVRGANVSIRTIDEFKKYDPKQRLLFLSDIISLFGPIRLFEIYDILNQIYSTNAATTRLSDLVNDVFIQELKTEVALLETLRIVKKQHEVFYYRASNENWLFYDYPTIRPEKIRADVIVRYNKKARDRMNLR